MNTMLPTFSHQGKQAGSMLLEGLIAVLIFSMGILAIVGMQAAAVSASTDAKYRSDAALLANRLIGTMWVSNRTIAALQTNFNTGGAGYNTWSAEVASTLPGVAANPPTVAITDISSGGSQIGSVTITLFWLAPHEPAGATAHKYKVTVDIGCAVQASGLCT